MKRLFSIAVIFLLFNFSSFARGINSDTSRHDSLMMRDGSSFEGAITINQTNESEGDAAEYKWLSDYYPGYAMISQSLVFHNKRPYDILNIKTVAGGTKDIYFDISNFFGKW